MSRFWRCRVARTILAGLLCLACGQASAQVSLKGRVLDVRSEPLPRALVEVLEPESRRDLLVRVVEGRQEPEAVARTMAGQLGDFELQLPGSGPWVLVVSAPGYLPQLRTVRPLPTNQVLPPAILQEAAVEQVDLKGTSGEAASGAWVEVEHRTQPQTLDRYSRFTGWESEPILGFADSQGTFRFVRGRTERLIFRVRMADASMRLAIGSGQETPAVDQAIQFPFVERSVRFVDAEGPVASALVLVDGRPLALTDRSGRVLIPVRRASQVEVLARNGVRQAWSLQGYAAPQAESSSSGPVDPASAENREVIELALSASSELRVLVQGADGQALTGALALVEGRLVRADEEGHLEFSVRHRGRLDLWIGAPNHLWRPLTGEDLSGRETLSWSLKPEVTVRGLVVDRERQPLANVDVAVTEVINGADAPIWSRSDSLGRVLLSGLAANEIYTVRPAWPRQGVGSQIFRSSGIARGEGPVRLELSQQRRVVGRVVSERGPVEAAAVHLRVGGVRPEPRRTDSNGLFAVRAAVGELRLRVSALGLADFFGQFDVPAGDDDWDLGEVALDIGSSMMVSVRGEEGEPIEGALVRMARTRAIGSNEAVGARPGAELRTDQEGNATLRQLSNGDRLSLVVEHDGYARETVGEIVVPRDEGVEVTLTPGFDLRGRVVDNDGSPVGRAFFGISPLGSEEAPNIASPYTGADGVIEIVGVPPGGYRIWARASDHAEIEPLELEVRRGERPDEFELKVPESAAVYGFVHSERGDALEEVAVVIAAQFARTGPAGQFDLEHVRLGDQTVEMRSPSGRRVRVPTTIERGQNSLDLIFPDSVRLEGRVVTTAGQPVEGAQVRFAGGTRAEGAETDDQGRFVLADVRERQGRLIATHGEARGSSEWFDVQAPPSIEIELTLRSRLRGLVTGASGEGALDRLRVFAERTEGGGELTSADRKRNSFIVGDGSFELQGLAPGTWRIRLVSLRSQGGGQTLDEEVVHIAEDASEPFVELHADGAELLENLKPLQGTVVIDGRPAGGLWLALRSVDGSTFWTRAEPSGSFEFAEAASGRYVLHTGDPGTVLHPLFDLDVPRSTPLDVQAERWVVQGTVRDRATGQPVSAEVRFLTGIEGSAEPHHSALNGRFRLEALALRPFLAEVSAAGFQPYQVDVRSSLELEIDLERLAP